MQGIKLFSNLLNLFWNIKRLKVPNLNFRIFEKLQKIKPKRFQERILSLASQNTYILNFLQAIPG